MRIAENTKELLEEMKTYKYLDGAVYDEMEEEDYTEKEHILFTTLFDTYVSPIMIELDKIEEGMGSDDLGFNFFHSDGHEVVMNFYEPDYVEIAINEEYNTDKAVQAIVNAWK